MTGVAGQVRIDCEERDLGAWLGTGPDGRAQRIEICSWCGKHGVRIVIRRQGARGRHAFAHVIRTDHYEQICMIVTRSAWRSTSTLRKRLGIWLDGALARERAALAAITPRPAVTPLKSVARRLGTSWQALRALPRCALLPSAEFRAALEADMKAHEDGPPAILATDWAADATQRDEWWPS